jgi:hypothetical protein
LRKELEEMQPRPMPWWLLSLLVAVFLATAVVAFVLVSTLLRGGTA